MKRKQSCLSHSLEQNLIKDSEKLFSLRVGRTEGGVSFCAIHGSVGKKFAQRMLCVLFDLLKKSPRRNLKDIHEEKEIGVTNT